MTNLSVKWIVISIRHKNFLVRHLMKIKGLHETHLNVRNLDVSIKFYRDVLELPLAHVIPARKIAFFWLPTPEVGMLGLWETGVSPVAVRSHFAFSVDVSEIENCVSWLKSRDLIPTDGEKSIDEPLVHTWMPSASVYFLDPDGHSLEYIAKLSDEPRADLDNMPLSAWRKLKA
jgi:lactoylglutathione lyase